MKQLDPYEVLGVVAPGAAALMGAAWVLTGDVSASFRPDATLGEFGVWVVASYVVGTLLAALGNIFEELYWKLRGGWPSGKLCRKGSTLLSERERALLVKKAQAWGVLGTDDVESTCEAEHRALTRQIYAALSAAGRTGRSDVFNRQYGLHRGMAMAMLCLAVLQCAFDPDTWLRAVLFLAAAVLMERRMLRFGEYFAASAARDFMTLPDPAPGASGSRK